jgi:hypothetical protein
MSLLLPTVRDTVVLGARPSLVARLADHFGVSIGFLVGEDIEAPDADEQLARMFRQASELHPDDRAILDDIVQSMLRRRRNRAAAQP